MYNNGDENYQKFPKKYRHRASKVL